MTPHTVFGPTTTSYITDSLLNYAITEEVDENLNCPFSVSFSEEKIISYQLELEK